MVYLVVKLRYLIPLITYIALANIAWSAQLLIADKSLEIPNSLSVIQILEKRFSPTIQIRLLVTPEKEYHQLTVDTLKQTFKQNDISQKLHQLGVITQLNSGQYAPTITFSIHNNSTSIKDASTIIANALRHPTLSQTHLMMPQSLQSLAQYHWHNRNHQSNLTAPTSDELFNTQTVTLLLSGSLSIKTSQLIVKTINDALPLSTHQLETKNTQKQFKDFIQIDALTKQFLFAHKDLTKDIDVLTWLIIQPLLTEKGIESPKLTHWPQQPYLSLSEYSQNTSLSNAQTRLNIKSLDNHLIQQRQKNLCQNLANILSSSQEASLNAMTFIARHKLPLDYFDHLNQKLCSISLAEIEHNLPNLLNFKSFSYVIIEPKNALH